VLTPSIAARALRVRLVVAAIALALPARARAADAATEMNGQARDLYELGMAHYRARGFSEAVRAFESAYQLDPQREILFALAQATRMSGDCPAAVPLYERFLATHPPERQVEATRIALGRCRERAAIEAAVKTRPTDPKLALNRDGPPPAAAVFRAPPPPRPRPAWYRDPATAVLAAAAAVSAGAGVGLLVAARLADREHRDAASYGQADERHAAARNRQRWAAAALVGGAAFTIGAGARWAWLRVSTGRREVAVALGTRF
jgi:tetratricopeptide (TPR) repeat protein